MLVRGRWKYVVGKVRMIESERGGPQYLNETSTALDHYSWSCPEQGCFFDVVSDPYEFNEVITDHPEVVAEMKAELANQAATIWSVSHNIDQSCWHAAETVWGNYFGPWKELGNNAIQVEIV